MLGYTRESTYSVVKELRGQSRDGLIALSAPGGDDRSRTGDPLLAKQVLSQLSYIPNIYLFWWAFLGSNQGPRAYQARALAS